LPYKLYIVNSVQEEIGLRGAQMVAQNIKPNVAVTDVCHETSSPCYTQVKKENISQEQVVLLQEHLLL
jgi:putative aminopeptidase FrvX